MSGSDNIFAFLHVILMSIQHSFAQFCITSSVLMIQQLPLVSLWLYYNLRAFHCICIYTFLITINVFNAKTTEKKPEGTTPSKEKPEMHSLIYLKKQKQNTIHNKVWTVVNRKRTKTNTLRGHIKTCIENIKLFKLFLLGKIKSTLKVKFLKFKSTAALCGGKTTKAVLITPNFLFPSGCEKSNCTR